MTLNEDVTILDFQKTLGWSGVGLGWRSEDNKVVMLDACPGKEPGESTLRRRLREWRKKLKETTKCRYMQIARARFLHVLVLRSSLCLLFC